MSTNATTIEATPRGLIPVSWMHNDFAPALHVHRLLSASLDAMWDAPDESSAVAFLDAAEAYLPNIGSDRIRESWAAVIASDRQAVEDLFFGAES